MLQWIGTIYNIICELFAWATFIFALVIFVVQIKRLKKSSFKVWLTSVLSVAYILFFLISKIFFTNFYESFFGTVALLFCIISIVWARYEDKRSGKRWWNW